MFSEAIYSQSASSYSAAMMDGGQKSSKRGKSKSKSRSRAASFVEQVYEDDSDSGDSDLQSYLDMGGPSDPADEPLRRVLAGMMNGPQAAVSGSKKSFTLPMKNNSASDLMKTFMACQNCSEIITKSKQLQCSHTICQKCAVQLRSKHLDPGQWMIRCLVCNLITTWYGNNLEGLKDNAAVQKLTGQRNAPATSNGIVQAKDGQITMYGDEDLTINIVSFSKEKAEIKKALENAERKIQFCQQQTKHIKEYEKRVGDAKSKLKKQLKHAAESYISAIRSQQAQMTEGLEELFKKDSLPAQKAKEAVEAHMQSLKLVTQCCCVASRILQNGGAPLDLDNFKRMVWQTMNRTRIENLPKAIQKPYKPSVFFKSNESNFDEISEKIGELVIRKERKKEVKSTKQVKQVKEVRPVKKAKQIKKIQQPLKKSSSSSSSSDGDERIYDFPPMDEAKYAQGVFKKADESIYDEIPFSSEMLIDSEVFANGAEPQFIPPPIPKSNFMTDDLASLPPPPPTFMASGGTSTLNRAAEKLNKRRQAIQGQNTSCESSEFSSSDSEEADENISFKPVPATRSRMNSTRSRASGYRSARESRSRPGSPTTLPRRKSVVVPRGFDDETYFDHGRGQRYSTATAMTGYDTQPEFQSNEGAMSKLMRRRKSLKNLGNLTSHFQQVMGSNSPSTPSGLNSEKLHFCIGKMKKPGSGGGGIQQFSSPPEFAVSEDDTIWIADSTSGRIQLHEGVNGRVVGSFKTTLQGITLKPRGITTLANGRQVAVSCGRFATVWTEGGELVRQVGPHSDFGKLGGITTDMNENLVLCDVENSRIVFTETGKIIYDAVTGGGNSGKSPWSGRIAINSFDQIICPDYGAHCVRIYSKNGKFITKFGAFGVGSRQFRYPSAVAVDSKNRIYVADECNNRVSVFSADGEDWLGHFLTKDDGLAFPHAISVFSDGAVAVADDNKVVKVYAGVE